MTTQTSKLLTGSKYILVPNDQNTLSTSVSQSFQKGKGFSTPDVDGWGKLFNLVKEIEITHNKYNDIETPLIPPDIIQGARRLIRTLEDNHYPLPTCMNGTVDATICFEWHEPVGEVRFISIDILGNDTYEIFTRYQNRQSTLKVESF